MTAGDTGVYGERPWLARYREDYPTDITAEYGSMLALFDDALARAPQTEIVKYFDGGLTLAQLDELSDAFAVALVDRGFAHGDRLATYLQNIPQALIAVIGTWKAGGVVVSINPMSRERELTTLLTDCGATAIVAQEDLWEIAAKVVPDSTVRICLTTSPLEFQTRHDPRLFDGMTRNRATGTEDLTEVLESVAGRTPEPVELGPDDVAFLGYTSGTTGPPKGAMNTHGNVVFNALRRAGGARGVAEERDVVGPQLDRFRRAALRRFQNLRQVLGAVVADDRDRRGEDRHADRQRAGRLVHRRVTAERDAVRR